MTRIERRKSERVHANLTGFLQGPDEVECRVANISRNGAMAISANPLPELTQVKIRLQPADGEPEGGRTFSCEAAVVRCDRRPDGSFDLGLFFTSMTEQDREVLQEILRARATIPAC